VLPEQIGWQQLSSRWIVLEERCTAENRVLAQFAVETVVFTVNLAF
jgi:hypothetical protein